MRQVNTCPCRNTREVRPCWLGTVGATGLAAAVVILAAQTSAQATARPITVGDYTGDHKTDITVYRPSNGTWYSLNSTSGAGSSTQFGVAGDVPVSGDFRYGGAADGITDVALFRPSEGRWYWIDSANGYGYSQYWGMQGDIPAVGDFDGDGLSDITIWRHYVNGGYPAGMWWVINSHDWSVTAVQWGVEGDIPVPCDYDGDGKSDFAVFRPSSGTWYVSGSLGGYVEETLGAQGDVPVPGDYDGDGKCDLAYWNPSNGSWIIHHSYTGTIWGPEIGGAGDIPAPGDYDGDGLTDTVVWQPTGGGWTGTLSGGQIVSQTWGSGGPNNGGIGSDVPLPNFSGATNLIPDVLVGQEQYNWCWAATAQMAAAYSAVSMPQCEQANVAFSRTDCCTNPASASDPGLCNQGGWWDEMLNEFTYTDLWDSAITFTQLQSELNANRPVPFAWLWSGGTSGHAMVATKTWVTSAGTQWVTINNPDPVGQGEQDDITYSYWVSAPNDHVHWRDSYNVILQ